jgi:hypothetical protein
MGTLATLAAIAWNPEIRNILSVSVGVIVLCGSVYLLIATNTGIRSGFLITLTALFGWMATMGVVWWIYGIGMQGAVPSWKPEELNYTGQDYAGLGDASLDQARDLTALAELPTAQDFLDEDPGLAEEILPPELFEEGADPAERDARIATITIGQIIEVEPELGEQFEEALGGWHLLAVSDRQRGDAAATADAFLGPDGRGLFEASNAYLVRDVFSIGGKPPLDDDSTFGRVAHKLSTIIKFRHPAHYAVVQIQAVEAVEVVPGEAPPPPELDEDAPVISVVLVRDLGDKRFPAAMTTLFSTLLFALFAWMLHRRDALISKARAAAV